MNHNEQVAAFLKEAQQKDPEYFQEVCKRNPTLTPDRWKSVRKKEICVGLLGLSPVPISPNKAYEHGVESIYDERE